MKKPHTHDIQHLKNSILTESDLLWLKNQIETLALFLKTKNQSRQKEAHDLLITLSKIITMPSPLEIRFYICLIEMQQAWRHAAGKYHVVYSLFYDNHGDRLIEALNQDKDQQTFARGIGTLLQKISDEIPKLSITQISESGKKELIAEFKGFDQAMPSVKEIDHAQKTFVKSLSL